MRDKKPEVTSQKLEAGGLKADVRGPRPCGSDSHAGQKTGLLLGFYCRPTRLLHPSYPPSTAALHPSYPANPNEYTAKTANFKFKKYFDARSARCAPVDEA